jgi:hypothetical protein
MMGSNATNTPWCWWTTTTDTMVTTDSDGDNGQRRRQQRQCPTVFICIWPCSCRKRSGHCTITSWNFVTG